MDFLEDSSSESDEGHNNPGGEGMDSDEEERRDNDRILRMLSLKSSESSKGNQKILDFEAEMEAELDRRASVIENEGGMEHQRSLSRSSSTSSLNNSASDNTKLRSQEPGASTSQRSSMKSGGPPSGGIRKKVKFASSDTEANGEGIDKNPPLPHVPGEESKDDSFYDNIYFDSDESEEENDDLKSRRKAKRKLMSNDELFYDPNADAADQAWVDKQRRKLYSKPSAKPIPSSTEGASTSGINSCPSGDNPSPPTADATEVPLPTTDAVLNCPACFTVLCMDCQRHEFYAGQYRAMFVMNCKVDKSETLTVPLKSNKLAGRKGKKQSEQRGNAISNVATNASDTFFPVQCRVCNSQVAVYDSEEIYHFFNCLASHP